MNYYDYKPSRSEDNNNYLNNYDYHKGDSEEVISIGMWILILILTAIPFLNIIALLVMAFGVSNKNIQNYGKATLILTLVGFILIFLFKY